MGTRTRKLMSTDIASIAGQVAGVLRQSVVRRQDLGGPIAGWHSRFAANRIGAPGAAVPMQFLREMRALDEQLEAEIVRGLLDAQLPDGGWRILSVAASSSTEGTATVLRSLSGASGAGVAKSIGRATEWLTKHQSADGGWGSTNDHANLPRTALTAAAIHALACLDAPDREVIRKGVDWLTTSQNSDGSWGLLPGDRGTVVHTALALRGMAAAGHHRSPAVSNALTFINRTWRPDASNVEQEAYDFHVGNAYHRVTSVYDVDAEVVLALLEHGSLGTGTRLWDVVSAWVGQTRSGERWWEHPTTGATLWTLVPRGLAALRLGRRLGVDGCVRWGRDAVALTATARTWPLWRLVLVSLRLPHTKLRIAVQVVCLVLVAVAVLLLATGRIRVTEMVIGVLLPLTLFALQQMPHR